MRGNVDELLAKRMDRVFMPHGLGHFLGLDVHDMSAEGMVPPQVCGCVCVCACHATPFEGTTSSLT